MEKTGRPATGLSDTPCHIDGCEAACWWRITALARSRNSRAEVLKSSVAGSRTVRYKSGRRNFKTLFDSTITLRASSILRRKVGIASASLPCSVRTHKARLAPATRNREESDCPLRSLSSEIAQL